MTTPEDRVTILKAENQRLTEYLNSLPEDAWDDPSACDQWTVADVIAHLTAGLGSHATHITDAFKADVVNPESLPRRTNRRVDATAVAESGISLRKDLGSQLLPEFVKASEAMEQALDQVGPGDWNKLCYRPNGAEPIGNILDQFITEFAVHSWDITFLFDPKVKLSQDCLDAMVERYPHRTRWWEIELPTNHPPLPVRFRFKVSAVSIPGTDFVISAQQEKFMELAGDSPADVHFLCDSETFILTAYGRMSLESAISNGTLTFEGSQEWAEVFIRSFTGG